MRSIVTTITVAAIALITGWLMPRNLGDIGPAAADAQSGAPSHPVFNDTRLITHAGGIVSPRYQPDSRLDRIIPKVEFNDTPLDEAFRFVFELGDISYHIHWSALEQVAVMSDDTVTLSTHNVSVRAVLSLLLEHAGAGQAEIRYTMSDGIVRVSTREDLAQDTETVVYDVADLVRKPMSNADREIIDAALARLVVSDYQRRAMTEGGVEAIEAMRISDERARIIRLVEEVLTEDRSEELVQTIQWVVDAESWRVNGGNIGGISPSDGKLIIVQTHEAQVEIAQLLLTLRQVNERRIAQP